MNFFRKYRKLIGLILVCFFTIVYIVLTIHFIVDIKGNIDFIADRPYRVAYEISRIRARVLETNAYFPLVLADQQSDITDIRKAVLNSQQENNKAIEKINAIYLGDSHDILLLNKELNNFNWAILDCLDVYEKERLSGEAFNVAKFYKNTVEPQRKKVMNVITDVIDKADIRVEKIKDQTEAKANLMIYSAVIVGALLLSLILYSLWSEYRKNIELKMQKRILTDALKSADAANAAKRNFLSRVSHEIRTPMNAIIGMTTIAGNNLDDKKRIADCLEKIGVSSKHLLMLINDVLDMSKIEDGKMSVANEYFSFREWLKALEEIITSSTNAKEQSFEVTLLGITAKQLRGDALRLSQVMINILSNAIKFTPEGGAINLKIEQTRCENDKLWLQFTVEDNGIGMSAKFLERLYEPFEQADMRGKGTGLGMAITKNMVALMNGIINVESTLGKGTTIKIDLPFGYDEEVENEDVTTRGLVSSQADMVNVDMESNKELDFSGYTLLVAEDNEINMEILSVMLESVGFSLVCTTNGAEALQAYEEGENNFYAAVLMDVQMPIMGGYAATRKIRASSKDDASTIPIIALTANAFDEDVMESYLAGMNEHMSKPIDFQKLFVLLDKLIKNKN